ncbi:MAG: hypothetical protein DWB56_06680 [Candidatus Jettenia sp.]|uniref:Uncharacterized protein n=1 Tax=Candidatus Jettenia caeni TaxID=247490 RepID=I3IN20_9BACT|nr:hypothetical protein [Candidatus Jettenia sp. AMX1]MBC6928638.1 hypothetical protein [Candidatus Jettenia sp.]GAB63115.1 hypothetical protein KSU1_C1519 [Candidatus Jettenia caeni]KAA0250616.1 MAG: hypothetical protein EDM77_03620 [Candidatus Jettenia sp. AMX1]MCE7879950.1 hypothetical protein [Candidatus Jettenia sp. AMX1]MCQ3926732.1 hypothetical protein [Candidatus Jettenia sp.]
MSATTHFNMDLIPTGAVEWPALINANTNKIEAGRTVKLTAGEALAARDPFYISSADGKAYKAANTNVCHGIWQSASTAPDATGYGQIDGVVTYGSWAWTKGNYIYVSAGKALTQTAPSANAQPVAYALSATEIVLLYSALRMADDGSISFLCAGSNKNILLSPSGTGLTEIRNSTNPQIADLYGTYTDGSNYEKLRIAANAGAAFTIAPLAAGSGTVRDVALPAGNVYVGGTTTVTAASKLNVIGAIKCERDDGSNLNFNSICAGAIPMFSAQRSRGTLASPATVFADDVLFRVSAKGHDGTSWPAGARTWIDFDASEVWTASMQGTRIIFNTTIRGGTSQGERMRIARDGSVCIGGTYEALGLLNLEGTSARILAVERNPASDTAGSGLTLQSGGATVSGIIHTVSGTPTAGGSGYVVGDILAITTGGTNGAAQVTTVDGGGAVTALILRDRGYGYTTGTGKATSGGTGTGCTVNITAVRTCADKAAGTLNLSTGKSVGTGGGSVTIQTPVPGATGSTDNTPSTKVEVDGKGVVKHTPYDNASTPVAPTSSLNAFLYNKSVDDDAVITLPSITTSGYGIVIAGDNTERTMFWINSTGTVALLNNSANVVANADTDANLCIGTAATQEPLQIKNRLGATTILNVMFWYD